MSDAEQQVLVAQAWSAPAEQRMTTPDDLLSLALRQGADLDRLERLMTLKREYEKDEARKAFAEAMAAFKAERITIEKDKFVSHKGGSYHHATLGNVVNVLAEALSRHGLYHTWATKQEGELVQVKCTLTHRLGHSESIAMSACYDNSGAKNSIQQLGSTITYLERYTLMAITGTAATDQDDDAASVQRGAGINDLLSAIAAAPTIAELQAIKSRIGGLEGSDKQACIAAYAARQAELSPV